MAQIETDAHARAIQIVAEDDDERALLAHACARGGLLPLLDATYPASPLAVALPDTTTAASAERVRAAFEAAAQMHRAAMQRRRTFRLV